MAKVIDREYLDIGGLEFQAESIAQNHDKAGTTINVMSRDGKPAGRASGNRTTEITADLVTTVDNQDALASLYQWFESDTEVPITVEQEGGAVTSYEAGVIDTISESSSTGDKVSVSVTITAWGRSRS